MEHVLLCMNFHVPALPVDGTGDFVFLHCPPSVHTLCGHVWVEGFSDWLDVDF